MPKNVEFRFGASLQNCYGVMQANLVLRQVRASAAAAVRRLDPLAYEGNAKHSCHYYDDENDRLNSGFHGLALTREMSEGVGPASSLAGKSQLPTASGIHSNVLSNA